MGNGASTAAAAAPPSDVAFADDDACGACDAPCAEIDALPLDRRRPLEGSVKPYGKHLGICTGERSWPPYVEFDVHQWAHPLRAALAAHAAQLPYKVLVTALDEPTVPWRNASDDAADEPAVDVLLFPDMLRFRRVSAAQLPLVAQFLAQPAGHPAAPPEGSLVVERLDGWYVVVCTHRQRDKRCGVAGPLLIEAFDEARHRLGIADRVHVVGSSHLGGHKLASVGVVYPSADCFGRMVPSDAEPILRELVCHGRVVRRKWRGRPPVVRSARATATDAQASAQLDAR